MSVTLTDTFVFANVVREFAADGFSSRSYASSEA